MHEDKVEIRDRWNANVIDLNFACPDMNAQNQKAPAIQWSRVTIINDHNRKQSSTLAGKNTQKFNFKMCRGVCS